MMLGGISDLWQREIMGIGPTGIDKGKGGKFLLLPPDYDGPSRMDTLAPRPQLMASSWACEASRSTVSRTRPSP